MTPEELFAHARVFALPMKREFRGVVVREGLLFEGPSGWGEFAPFHDHTDAHAAGWLEAALEQAFGTWPTPLREHIPVNAIIPISDAETARDWTEDALARGCTTVKIKVGSPIFDADVARVAAVRSAMDDAGVAGAIRIDVNRLWTIADALQRIPVLDAIASGLEYVEQPVNDRLGLRELHARLDVPIAVDEGIRLSEDPRAAAIALHEIADVAVLKAIPLGGVRAALEVAEHTRLPVVVSGSLDTSVGLASGLHLAGALPDLPYACGFGTGALLRNDVVTHPRRVVDGHLVVERVVPEQCDPASLVDAAMRARWRARLERAWQHARIPAQVEAM